MGPGLLGDIPQQTPVQGLLADASPNGAAPAQPAGDATPTMTADQVQAAIAKSRPGFWGTLVGALGREGSFDQIRDKVAQANLARQFLPYQIMQQQAFYRRLSPNDRALYDMDPQGFAKMYAQRVGPLTMKPGEVGYGYGAGGDQTVSAPTVLSEGQTLTGTTSGQPLATGIVSAPKTNNVYGPNAALNAGGGGTGAPSLPRAAPAVPTKAAVAGGGNGASAPNAGSGQAAPGARFQNFASSYLFPTEGGYTANDGNGAPANFGINQAANPDVNVKALTKPQAAKLMYDRYWVPSGADKLPAGLGEIQADTAINMGLPAAQRLLVQSNGDAGQYLALREQAYRAMAAQKPALAERLPSLLARNAALGQYASSVTQGATQGAPQPPAAEGAGGAEAQPTGQPGMLQSASGYRQLVTPQDRTAHGILASDRAGYALDPEGKVVRTAEDPFGPIQQMDYTTKALSFEPLKNYITTRGFLEAAKQSMTQKGGFADLNLIDMAGKSVNPTLAMRPNMIEAFGKERGWTDSVIGSIRATLEHGQQLDDAARNALYNTIYTNTQAHYNASKGMIKKIKADAQRYGVSVEDLIPDLQDMPEAPAPSYGGKGDQAEKVRVYNPKSGALE